MADASRRSDLPTRTASAVLMVILAGTALWLGGWVWAIFVALVAAGVMWEWAGLVRAFAARGLARPVWLLAGAAYVCVAAFVLEYLRSYDPRVVLLVVLPVIGTDIGAYFAGRAIGGPKIAPAISPSKTWAGLAGGVLGASAALFGVTWWLYGSNPGGRAYEYLLFGGAIAVIAQIGDFFESWMKRRARVKDSGRLLPGHGGLFDRADGLLAVCAAMGLWIGLAWLFGMRIL